MTKIKQGAIWKSGNDSRKYNTNIQNKILKNQ